MKEYDARDFAHRLVRYRKYLIPAAGFMPWLPRESAPPCFGSLQPSIADSPRDRLISCERITLAPETTIPADTVTAYFDGGAEELPLASLVEHEQTLFVLPRGSCVGRNGCLATADNLAVRDTAFLGKYGVEGIRSFSRMDPRNWIHRRRGNLTARRSIPAPLHVAGAAISMNNCSSHNFFHWLTEVAPRAIAASRYESTRSMKFIVDHQQAYQREILRMLGTEPYQWIQPHSHLHLQPDQLLWCNEPTSSLLRQFASILRQQLARTNNLPKKIYISRKKASHRKLLNEQEVEQQLQSQGFATFDFETLPIRTQIELFASAETVVALHGAALAHLLFASPGTRVIELYPTGRRNYDLYPRLSRMLGLNHTLVLTRQSKHRQRMEVQCQHLLNALHDH